jgi:hypothetical protein
MLKTPYPNINQKEYISKRSALEKGEASTQVTWLKILYRLGLVFLCMVLVHAFVRQFKTS